MKFLASLALMAALLLSSCGGGDGGGGGGGAPAPEPTPKPLIDLTSLEPAEASRTIVSQVMETLPEGQTFVAKGTTASQCGGTPFHYTLTRSGSKAKIGLKTFFEFQDYMTSDDKRQMLAKVTKCLQPTKDFYAQYNIEFDWTFRNAMMSTYDSSIDHVKVMLDSEDGRAKSVHWYANSFGVQCKVIIHEVGHLLGLPDEYYEAGRCRTAAFESPTASIMKDHTESGADLLPRHVAGILDQAVASKVSLEKVGNNFDTANEVQNLKAELEAYGCTLESPQNLVHWLDKNGKIEYKESDNSSYIITKIEMQNGSMREFKAEWEYFETTKWNRPTAVQCKPTEFGKAIFAGESFPFIFEALGSSALRMGYSSINFNAYHSIFQPMIYSGISNLKDEKVVESDLVERNYY